MMAAKASRLGLGTSQFGLVHDISNPRGRISLHELRIALRMAAEAGIEVLDLGGQPGEAEARLGESLPQPSPFKAQVRALLGPRGAEGVEAQARDSLERLGLERADSVLAASAADLLGPEGPGLWRTLKRLKHEGLCARIGVSLTAEDDPLGVARRFKPDLMQLPVSLLDQRLVTNGTLAELAARGVDVQLRSIFLHGLLFLPGHDLPPALASAAPRLSRIRRMLAEAGADPLQAALAFALGRPEASAVVVGVASAAELRAILAAAAAPSPALDWAGLALDPTIALDPQLWAAA
jgi:aryl-alcohol dehydrogenase-like predicted oxidoreductase